VPTATTFTSAKQFVGVAKETFQGTPLASTFTLLVEKFTPEDKPVWLDDHAMRGSMVDNYGRQQGVIKTDFSMSGPAFGDGLGFLLANILGDLTTTGASAPFTHAFSLLNSGQGQPISHTLSHYQGPVASVGTRQYPGSCLSDLTLKWNAESQLLTFDAKGMSWPSVIPGATPTSSPTTVAPVPSWRGSLGIGGPASGGTLIKTITEGEISIKRELEPVFTTQGVQTPYIIQRGAVSVGVKLKFVAADESPYLAMIGNTQPQLQFVLDNGIAGAGQITFQVDIQKAAYKSAKYEAGKAAVAYDIDADAIANTTNAGASGGFSPVKVTLTNAITSGTYQ